mgnify:CR=1 FL=1
MHTTVGKAADVAQAVEALAGLGGGLGKEAFGPAFADFFMTNPIARASRVMAECSSVAHGRTLQAAE